MRILVDENIPQLTVVALRAQGHNVRDIRGTRRQGISDDRLWRIAQRGHRLIITTDKGFANQRDERHWGILIIRLRQPNRQRIHQAAMRPLARFQEDQWPGLLVIVRDRSIHTWRSPHAG